LFRFPAGNLLLGILGSDILASSVAALDCYLHRLDVSCFRQGMGQSLSILDPETKAPAVKNPFLQPKPGLLTVDEMAIDRVLADGVVIGACNIALKVLSGKLAQNAGVSAEEAAKEWAANIIPGITVIPSGTWGLNRAQEHGCTYCAGG
jgi:hypothetical protein